MISHCSHRTVGNYGKTNSFFGSSPKRSNIKKLLSEWHWQMLSILAGVKQPVVCWRAGDEGEDGNKQLKGTDFLQSRNSWDHWQQDLRDSTFCSGKEVRRSSLAVSTLVATVGESWEQDVKAERREALCQFIHPRHPKIKCCATGIHLISPN